MNKVEQAIQIIKQQLPKVDAIYTFGSYGTAYETAESDLDLAILLSHSLNSLQCWQLAQDIAYAVHSEIDLINLNVASTVLRFEIISSSKRVYCRNADLCDLFETIVYSAYVRFNDERRGLLTDIQQRGQIHHG